MNSHSLEFPADDYRDLSALTELESHTIEGQKRKMELVERMLRDRYESHSASVKTGLASEGYQDEELDAECDHRLQKIRIRRMELGDGRFNLIVAKGNGEDDPPDPTLYRVMIPAHVDTVDSGASSGLTMNHKHSERAQGLGVYDMAQGVVNSIALAATTQVPEGMIVYFVFTVDEEKKSRGSRELIKQWEIWPHIDAVLSSEIAPIPPLAHDDPQMRLVTARAGRAKFLTTIGIDPSSTGHGSIDDLPNAGDALRTLQNRWHQRFYQGYSGAGASEEPAQVRRHALLGSEKIETGIYQATASRDGYVPTDAARLSFAVKMVPPSTHEEMHALFSRWARGIAKAEKWPQYGISHTIAMNMAEASYSPYEMPGDHALVKIATEILTRVSGVVPEIVGAPSVADECDYAADMMKRHAEAHDSEEKEMPPWHDEKGVITIPTRGDKAHHPDEWVSLTDIMRVREAFRLLIEDEEGFIRIHRSRKEKREKKT